MAKPAIKTTWTTHDGVEPVPGKSCVIIGPADGSGGELAVLSAGRFKRHPKLGVVAVDPTGTPVDNRRVYGSIAGYVQVCMQELHRQATSLAARAELVRRTVAAAEHLDSKHWLPG